MQQNIYSVLKGADCYSFPTVMTVYIQILQKRTPRQARGLLEEMPVKEMNRKLEKVEGASDYNAELAPVKGGGEEGGPDRWSQMAAMLQRFPSG